MKKLNGILGAVWVSVFAQIDLKNAYIKINDGSGTPKSLTVKIGEGNLTYSEKRTIEYTLDRGRLDEVREGDEVPVDVSLDFLWDYIKASSGSGTPTVEEAMKKTGEASDWISTDEDQCRPYAVDIVVEYFPTPWDCGDSEIITLSDYRYESLDHDLRAGTIATSGRCNVTQATVVRATQSSTTTSISTSTTSTTTTTTTT